MIIGNNVQAVEFGNVEQGGEFKIRNSAKAFSILSSGLYANKIRAIIRELSCNALDGHIANGNIDRQFEVHLPTRMEPHFAVRDYGIGLSHEDILNVYTTYFESTKTGSNDMIGGLGLGCKSPFSYTDNFTVTSIQNGISNLYTAYINENGLPSITRMASSETDEETGVEVRFPVNEYDFSKFNREASFVFKSFKEHPIVTGNYSRTEVIIKRANIIDGVDLRDNDNDGAFAIMGNIVYPIDVPNKEQNLGDLAPLLKNGLNIRFGIGELDIQASREGLSYIPSTIKAIKDKAQAINDALAVVVADDIKTETNAWNRKYKMDNLAKTPLFAQAVRQHIKNNDIPFTIKDTGRTVDYHAVDVELIAKKFNVRLEEYAKNYRGKVSRPSARVSQSQTTNPTLFWNVTIKPTTLFVTTDDTTKQVRGRLAKYAKEQMVAYGEMYVIYPDDVKKPVLVKEFLKSIYEPITMKLSDMAEPPKRERAASAKGSILVANFDDRYSSTYGWSEFDFDEDHDDTQTYYYVPLNSKQVVSEKFGDSSLNAFLSNFTNLGVDAVKSFTIHGVRKSAIKDVAELENWVNFEEYICELLAKELTKPEICNKIAILRDGYINQFSDSMIKQLKPTSPLRLSVEKFSVPNLSHRQWIDVYKVQAIAKKVNCTVDIQKSVDNVAKECHNIKKRYPMLVGSFNSVPLDAVVEYVNLIDNHKGV